MKTVINIKADEAVKKNAQKIASDLGLSLSAVINAYLKQLIRSKSVYFSAVPKMTPELETLIGRADEDYKKKRNISPIFSTSEEMDEYLNSL
jgi:addiction module RelB/DinJ family antitoxin